MIKYNYLLILIVMLGITFSCGDDSITNPPEEIEQDITKYELLYGELPDPNLPADNELTEQGVALGRIFFMKICFREMVLKIVQVVIDRNMHLVIRQGFHWA